MVQGDYSRHIREASMAMDGLPEGVSPSGRVPEQLLQAAPILKRRRRRYREEFAKRGSVLGFPPRGLNIGEGGVEGTHEAVRRVPGAAQGGAAPPALLAAWWWPPFPLLVIPEASVALIFYIFSRNFWSTFKGRKT